MLEIIRLNLLLRYLNPRGNILFLDDKWLVLQGIRDRSDGQLLLHWDAPAFMQTRSVVENYQQVVSDLGDMQMKVSKTKYTEISFRVV